jgi:hypothetical protein
MRKLSIASLGESQTVPVTVALCLAPLASLVAASSDDLCCFGVDEGLEHELHPLLADDIHVTACSRGLEHVGNFGTGEGHSRTSSDEL